MGNKHICSVCKLNKNPRGCNTSIYDMEVVKGTGVISCKRFIQKKGH